MCEATTIMFVAGLALTAYGGYETRRAQINAGEAAQDIANNNAQIAGAQAKDEAILSAREQQTAAWRTRALIGQQKTAMAANNIDAGEGTAFDLLGESALFGGAEMSAISQDAARKAWGYESQALNYRNEGAQARYQGKAAGFATTITTLGSLASQGSSLYGGMRGGAGNSKVVGGTLRSGRGVGSINSGASMRFTA